MPALYLTEQGSTLRCVQGRLLVEHGSRVLLCVPLLTVDSVLVFGNVQVTTQAFSALSAHRVEVAFLSQNGRLKSRMVPGESKNVPLRLLQFERHTDAAFRLTVSRSIVHAKLNNQRAVLQRYARNHRQEGPQQEIQAAVRTVKQRSKAVAGAETCAVLFGIEGAAACQYFAALRHVVPAEVGFVARRRRPACDPFNALLGLGYSLAGSEIAAVLGSCGLDPCLGFLHCDKYGRPAMALDLLEEFRAPLVDRLTISLLNLRILQTKDFESSERGLRLRTPALRRSVRAYEKAINSPFKDRRTGSVVSFRKLIALQVRRLVRAVESEGEYVPYQHN